MTEGSRFAALEVLTRLEAIRTWASYALEGHIGTAQAIDASQRLLAKAALWERAT
jgi:hypothetical protein